jgi:hypothetical protein
MAPVALFRSGSPRAALSSGEASTPGELGASDRALRCAACGNPLARAADVCAPGGGLARRVFANPAGRVFEVVCVRRMLDAHAVGRPTLEHTWFPGLAWSVLLCGKCAAHVGWRFHGEGGFFALITTAVVESGSDG